MVCLCCGRSVEVERVTDDGAEKHSRDRRSGFLVLLDVAVRNDLLTKTVVGSYKKKKEE